MAAAGRRVKALALIGPVPREIERELIRLGRFRGGGFATDPLDPGRTAEPVHLNTDALRPIAVGAARRASGVPSAARRAEVVWAEGADELVVDAGGVSMKTADGIVGIEVPVTCDQTGTATVSVTFAVGSPKEPAGLIAAANRLPEGPEVIVSRWGNALVAFAWSVMLEIAGGVAAGTGVDRAGEPLIAGDLSATVDGLAIVPFARHRFGDESR